MRHYRFIFGVLFLLLLSVSGRTQQVRMLCTQVDNVGDITVSWESVAIPVGYEYEIWTSTKLNGTYILVGTEQTTPYIHSGANGGATQWFYFVKAVHPTIIPTYTSDTLGSLYFVLYNLKKGVARLSWERPSNPPLPTQDKEFVIYSGKGGVLQKLTQSDTTIYLDTLHVCGKMIDYQIILHDSRGCDNISFMQSDMFADSLSPATPQLDSVSINPNTNKTELGWEPSSSSDTYGYLIYIWNSGWHKIDTVFGAENTHYIDLKNDATGTSQQYRIAAIDTCFNASPMGDEHNSLISSASCTKCHGIINLSWNAYKNMPDSLMGYRIWASENGGNFYIVDTVPSNVFTYTHKGINEFIPYTYYVQAYNLKNGYTASSAKTDVNCNRIAGSGEPWLRYVSVVDNKDIEIAVYVKDTANYKGLFLFRSDDNGNHFSNIDKTTKAKSVENYKFRDTNVDVQTQTYLYTISLTDECDEPFAYSDTANNIILTALDSPADENSIQWTVYEGFDTRLDGYDVYRQLQTETTFQFQESVPASQTDFTENVGHLSTQGGRFLYQVAATEDRTKNPYNFSDKSFSNIVEITKSPQSFIPNAFTPNGDGLNEVFKPVLTYVDDKEYAFAIFDRWGNLIFYTNDISVGWDGTINGKPAMEGVYAYTLTYRQSKTKMYKKQGHVTLLR